MTRYLFLALLLLPSIAQAVPTGACCAGKDMACYIWTESACDAAGYTYMGDGVSCFTGPGGDACADYGACCADDGTCTIELQGDCEWVAHSDTVWAEQGEYYGYGTTCEVGLCLGGCCDAQNSNPPGQCVNSTRVWCWETTPAYGGDGSWGGYFTECDSVCSYLGACCTEADSCWITSEYVCETIFRDEFIGVDETCSPDPCDPSGACCFPDGTCSVMLEDYCGDLDYQGHGTTCSPNPCPQPTQEDLDMLDRRRRVRRQ